MVRRRAVAAAAALMVFVIGGCELEDVTIPGGDPVVIVHAVMRPDLPNQFVVVERSFDGIVDPTSETGAIPPNFPRLPIAGAVIEVENLDLPVDPCGTPVLFDARPPLPYVQVPGVYWGPTDCPTMRAGDRLELTVRTTDGETVTGVTRIPGMTEAALVIGADSIVLAGDTVLGFNRDRDTLRIRVAATVGRLLQVGIRRDGIIDDDGTTVFADTTAVAIPGDAIDLFFTRDGSDVFLGGRQYVVSVALSDSNYYDFARSRSNPFTGSGFINHLTGGVGLFGSAVAATARLAVVSEIDDPREGIYRLTGQVEGVDVDATLGVYFTRPLESADFSAFLTGSWFARGSGPEGALIHVARSVRKSIDGRFDRDSLFATIQDTVPGGQIVTYVLSGTHAPTASFPLLLGEQGVTGVRPLSTLTAEPR